MNDQIESLSAESQSDSKKYFVYFGDDKFVFEANDNMDGLNQFNEDAPSKFEIYTRDMIIFKWYLKERNTWWHMSTYLRLIM